MNLAVASGKGGTGKTTVAASLARVWSEPVVAVDLDVEEPNLHLFLRPVIAGSERALLQVPTLDESLCDACGACADLCQFKAISQLGKALLIFSDMCHGCGGCLAICPRQAFSASARELGKVSWGASGQVGFLMGRLRVGEAMSPPLMREVHARLRIMLRQTPGDVIVDAPPGVSCPALSAVMGSDAILLVTEPTPFGLYDLRLAHQAFAPLSKPLGVVINRAGLGDSGVREFCRRHDLPVLIEIPFQRQAAEAYSRGQILAEASPAWRELFLELAAKARALARPEAAGKETAHA
jgi:MinD superfamily P-loop ATPase